MADGYAKYEGRGRYNASVVTPGAWNSGPLRMGANYLWVSSGKLYIKTSAPTNATDGTVVGTQA